MWLIRGTGRGGLSGMEAATVEGIIRPLIMARRSAVRAHLRSRGEVFRDDSTNDDRARTRNRIRATLVPLLDKEFPGGLERMAAAAGAVGAEEGVLDSLAADLLVASDGAFAAGGIPGSGAGRALAARAVRLAAARQGMDPRLLERDHVEAILGIARGGTHGAGIDLPGGFRAEWRTGGIYFSMRERLGPARG